MHKSYWGIRVRFLVCSSSDVNSLEVGIPPVTFTNSKIILEE
ncbi:MAG: hypothetical protein ACE5DT_07925 [Nitrosopumilus sp.]